MDYSKIADFLHPGKKTLYKSKYFSYTEEIPEMLKISKMPEKDAVLMYGDKYDSVVELTSYKPVSNKSNDYFLKTKKRAGISNGRLKNLGTWDVGPVSMNEFRWTLKKNGNKGVKFYETDKTVRITVDESGMPLYNDVPVFDEYGRPVYTDQESWDENGIQHIIRVPQTQPMPVLERIPVTHMVMKSFQFQLSPTEYEQLENIKKDLEHTFVGYDHLGGSVFAWQHVSDIVTLGASVVSTDVQALVDNARREALLKAKKKEHNLILYAIVAFILCIGAAAFIMVLNNQAGGV